MKPFYENPIFETVKSKVINSLFETVRLSVSISPRNLYNSLKSIKEKNFHWTGFYISGIIMYDMFHAVCCLDRLGTYKRLF